MKTEFKVGDRVRVYGEFRGVSTTGDFFYDGTVVTHAPWTSLLVRLDKRNSYGLSLDVFAHPKQCRRLKPKKRREWWLAAMSSITNDPEGRWCRSSKPADPTTWIHVREVKKEGV